MTTLRYTLLADGSSDAALKPIIEWLIREHRPDLGVLGEYAGALGGVGRSLETRIPEALKLFPCDVLIIHRDAEGESFEQRLQEMERALGNQCVPWIPLVPVRMTEAWLLSDENAIRSASENRNGTVALDLPRKSRWESLPDPKRVLFDALELASEKSARALRKFSPARQRALVAQRTLDYSGLRGLRSFDLFESALAEILRNF